MNNCCETTEIAARNGHLECLKTLYSQGVQWHPETSYFAGIFGHLDCLKYAHENGCPWDEYTIPHIAGSGHLECLKYAHSLGYGWHPDTTAYAARNGYLECLLYCLENNCPISSQTLSKLYTSQTDKNLSTNLLLRKVLLHPRLQNKINIRKYPKFTKAIEEYNCIYI
jgi:hypothetical protein